MPYKQVPYQAEMPRNGDRNIDQNNWKPEEKSYTYLYSQSPCCQIINIYIINLKTLDTYCQHPCSIFYFTGIGFHITVIKGAPRVHVHLVIISQMSNQVRNIPQDWALWTSIWAVIGSKNTNSLVFQLTVIRENLGASKGTILAWKFERLSNLF